MSHDPNSTQPLPRTMLADEVGAHRAHVAPVPSARRRSRLPIALGTTAVVLLSMLGGALVVSRTDAPATTVQSASAKSSTSVSTSAASLPTSIADTGDSSASDNAVAEAGSDAAGSDAGSSDQDPSAGTSSPADAATESNDAPAPAATPALAPKTTNAPSTTAAPKSDGDKKIVPVPTPGPAPQPSTTVPLPTTTAPKPLKVAPTIKFFMYTRDATCRNLLDEDWVPVNYEILNADSVVITTGEGYDHKNQPAKAVQTFRVKCDGTSTSITVTATSPGGTATKTVTVPLHRVAP